MLVWGLIDHWLVLLTEPGALDVITLPILYQLGEKTFQNT